MSDTKHVVLIHGAWSRGELAPAREAFEERGYTAHTPTLRHHELPLHEGAMKIASLSLRDYTDDLVRFVNSLDSPPLLVGHSMGGLLAQLVAARTRHAGLVAECPGSAAGIFGTTPTNMRMSLPAFLTATPPQPYGGSPACLDQEPTGADTQSLMYLVTTLLNDTPSSATSLGTLASATTFGEFMSGGFSSMSDGHGAQHGS